MEHHQVHVQEEGMKVEIGHKRQGQGDRLSPSLLEMLFLVVCQMFAMWKERRYHLGKNRDDKMAQHGLLFIINSIQGMHMKRVNFFFFLKGVEYVTCYFEEPNRAKENLMLFSCISRTKIALSKYRRFQARYESMPINQVKYLELMQPFFF